MATVTYKLGDFQEQYYEDDSSDDGINLNKALRTDGEIECLNLRMTDTPVVDYVLTCHDATGLCKWKELPTVDGSAFLRTDGSNVMTETLTVGAVENVDATLRINTATASYITAKRDPATNWFEFRSSGMPFAFYSAGNFCFRSASASHIYFDAGGLWRFRDVDASWATRIDIDSSNGDINNIGGAYKTNGTTRISYDGHGTFVNLSASGQLTLSVAVGTAPLVVTSTTAVANLNADLLDGNHAAAFEPAITADPGETGDMPKFWRGDKTWQYLHQNDIAELADDQSPEWAGLTVVGTINCASLVADTVSGALTFLLSPPAVPSTGAMYYDSGTNEIMVFDGSEWHAH